MNTWYSTATPEGVARIEAAWADAPTTNLELCELIFETAREQVIAYAPAPGEETGELVLGPVTVARRNCLLDPAGKQVAGTFWNVAGAGAGTAVSGAIRATRTGTGSVATYLSRNRPEMPLAVVGESWVFSVEVRASEPLRVVNGFIYGTSSTAIGGVTFDVDTDWRRVSVPFVVGTGGAVLSPRIGWSAGVGDIGSWQEYRNASLERATVEGAYFDGNTPPLTVDDRTYSHAWVGAENASPSVETYRPFVFIPMYPTRLVYAQLQQARNLWLAGRTDASGDIGGDFSYTPRPLDKTIRGIIRPESVAPSVY